MSKNKIAKRKRWPKEYEEKKMPKIIAKCFPISN
jgi:hypothetical protein